MPTLRDDLEVLRGLALEELGAAQEERQQFGPVMGGLVLEELETAEAEEDRQQLGPATGFSPPQRVYLVL